MRQRTADILEALMLHYPTLESCRQPIVDSVETLISCYRSGGKLLTCGNGGSAADAQHIVGELMKAFVLRRELPEEMRLRLRETCEDGEYIGRHLQGALPAIALVCETALLTAFENDVAPDLAFAQQVHGYGNSGDVLLAISTSGNSKNVIYAAETARARGMAVIALTGSGGGRLARISDCCIGVPETETYRIQELHLPVYHAVCLALENEFFGD